MRILSTLLLSLALMLHSIELSLQSDGSPESALNPIIRRDGTPHSPVRSSTPSRSRSRSPRPETDPAGFKHARLPPAEYDPSWFPPSEFDPARFHPDEYPEVISHHDRPPSPDRYSPPIPPPVSNMVSPTRLPSKDKHGCGIENLPFIRLTSHVNRSRVFELRRYTFPKDTRLKLRIEGRRQFEFVPTEEQIVFSTPDGEVFAILKNHNTLAGLYLLFDRRGKINMRTGIVTLLNSEEIKETPVGPTRPIFKCYDVKQVKKE